MSQQPQVPGTPRIISPTPPASDKGSDSEGYFAPVTRSVTKRHKSPATITEEDGEPIESDSSAEIRARARSRSAKRKSGSTSRKSASQNPKSSTPQSNGHLSPSSAAPSSSSYWRDISRSPSPLGLIPIHRQWRSFVHRHEIPRKILHVSIGFFTLHLFTSGANAVDIHPWLLGALVPIASVDYARHTFPSFNRFYIRVLGALMRESEVDGWNGVIWYLLGAWTVMRFFPKDVGTVSILLLSWCDTAASTFGRLWGRYTPRIRKGKSVAGSMAALVVGALTAGLFWGVVAAAYPLYEDGFEFKGTLRLPNVMINALGIKPATGQVGGWVALGIVSVWSGIVASASEVVDLFGWDDNLTIPVLSGLGLWGFFKAFC